MLSVAVCFLVVLFSLRLNCQAQTPTPTPPDGPACTPTPTITPPPPACTAPTPSCPPCASDPSCTPKPWPTPPDEPQMVRIPNAFQPNDGTGTILEWRVYAPGPGPGPWPVILLIHGGQWRSGSPFQGSVGPVAVDLRDNGFYVLVATYRLAPCGRITGQPAHDGSPAGIASGRPAQQIADIQALVRAARADSHCKNGEVGVVGGSAGGTHAIWAALDTRTLANWGPGDRPNCAVSLSGGYDLSDQDPTLEQEAIWIEAVQNYTNTCDRMIQKSFSPVSIVKTPTARIPFKPIFLINGSMDPMVPSRQIFDMVCALQSAGVNPALFPLLRLIDPQFREDHAFALWRDPLDDGSGQVRDRVFAFLHTYLP